MKKDRNPQSGISFPEVLISFAIIGLLATLATPSFVHWQSKVDLSNAAQRLAGDLAFATSYAVELGPARKEEGRLIPRKVVVHFNHPGDVLNSYRITVWEDLSEDSVIDMGEEEILMQVELKNTVTFGKTGIGLRACDNGTPVPDVDVTFDDSVGHPSVCLSAKGWSKDIYGSFNEGAAYLTNGTQSYAVSMSGLGCTEVCKWSISEGVWAQ